MFCNTVIVPKIKCYFSISREIQCLRNKIHANLFITYVLTQSCWIVLTLIKVCMFQALSNLISSSSFWAYVNGKCLHISKFYFCSFLQNYAVDSGIMATCIVFLLLKYFHLSTFFWMFIEGKNRKEKLGCCCWVFYTLQ